MTQIIMGIDGLTLNKYLTSLVFFSIWILTHAALYVLYF